MVLPVYARLTYVSRTSLPIIIALLCPTPHQLRVFGIPSSNLHLDPIFRQVRESPAAQEEHSTALLVLRA